MAVKDWSSTAASNTTILTGITLDGSSMSVPLMDDAFRDMAAQIAAQLGKVGFKGADMPSAATVNLAAATGWYVDVTGTTTITSLGTVAAGQVFILRFASSLTLTHHASTLILPQNASVVTQGGDVGIFVSLGGGGWRCINYEAAGGSIPAGTVVDFAGTTAPTGWLLCYGQSVSRATYAALFAAIGTTYGSINGSSFNLPDLRGVVVAGKDNMGGTATGWLTNQPGGIDGNTLGALGGWESHLLTIAQMPTHNHGGATGPQSADHNHSVVGNTDTHGGHAHTYNTALNGTGSGGSGARTGAATTQGTEIGGEHSHAISIVSSNVSANHNHAISADGSSVAHNIVQPTIILNKIIKV